MNKDCQRSLKHNVDKNNKTANNIKKTWLK